MTHAEDNASMYDALWQTTTHEYPAEWVIRFEAYQLRGKTGFVLDFGCGSGNNARLLSGKGWTVTALDPSPAAVKATTEKVCGKHDYIGLISPTARRVDFEDGTFEVVLANQSLYYLEPEQGEAMIQDLWRVVKPGGWFIASFMSRLNHYIAQYGEVIGRDLYQVTIPEGHRLAGHREVVWAPHVLVLRSLFSSLKDIRHAGLGYYDSLLPGKDSNHHWLLWAQKA